MAKTCPPPKIQTKNATELKSTLKVAITQQTLHKITMYETNLITPKIQKQRNKEMRYKIMQVL